jgi:hypothetical protein
MAGMKRLIAVVAVVAGLAFPLCAQRGGGGHRGVAVGHSVSRGSFASSGAQAFRGGVPAIGRVNFMGVPQLSASRFAAVPSLSVGRGLAAAYPGRRPAYPGRNGYRRPYLPAYGLGFPTGYSVWPGSLDPGYYDPSFYNGSGYADSGYADQGYATPAPPAGYAPPPYAAAEVAPPDAYRPTYQTPQPPPQPEDAVTLVFKDGRPTEEIHNYMLTRTTLYVQDAHRREIPVDDLDLAATQKINKSNGVDFQLPGVNR